MNCSICNWTNCTVSIYYLSNIIYIYKHYSLSLTMLQILPAVPQLLIIAIKVLLYYHVRQHLDSKQSFKPTGSARLVYFPVKFKASAPFVWWIDAGEPQPGLSRLQSLAVWTGVYSNVADSALLEWRRDNNKNESSRWPIRGRGRGLGRVLWRFTGGWICVQATPTSEYQEVVHWLHCF